ncbi:uncharacterized protein LOC123322939 [Coccinella septempunctata]|uniref:uncharacterized protein LOC123322939 n=1 Tax=Coccinella septempunctata TaxID=41139 RepID=UPI001D0949D6|nr:uncharacterized protein LOC123322939 [Coccinella septempunctata]
MNKSRKEFDEHTAHLDRTLTRSTLSDGDEAVKKIYPSKSELSIINNSIKCTEEKCKEIFTSCSNLNLHLYKTHNKKDAIKFDTINKQYYCPEIQCIYHQSQWFKNKKLLKQHYLKVHSPKIFVCETCNEGFATKAFKNMHVDYCGVKFKCSECPISYPKYESLLTHARRKEHKINDKIYFKLKKVDDSISINISKSDSNLLNRIRPILPKPTSSVNSITNCKSFNRKNDQSIQTDHISPKLKSKITQINRNSLFRKRDTRQTQTGFWKEQLSIETQTIGDFTSRNNMELNGGRKFITTQSSTQTSSVDSKSASSNTFPPINDLNLSSTAKRSSSSTQTLEKPIDNFSATTNTHDTIDTDTSDLIESNLDNFDSNYFNCNMETQTDLIFNEDLFDYGDYYSNMYTQTCENLLLNSLELNHIETQTVDDMLKSVEIQTMMSHKKSQINCRDISHMETQTDVEVKQMLEVMNA